MEKKLNNQRVAEEIIPVLKKKGYDSYCAKDVQEARKIILEMVPEQSVIGLGGSITLGETGVIETFRKGNYRLIDRYNQPSKAAMFEAYKEALHADYFLCGTNAMTQKGELVNIDASGNRLAAMIYGPERVIIVTGVNKIVDSLEDAFMRIKRIAPLNCQRFKVSAPCVETGECVDCEDPQRMCNYTTIIHNGHKFKGRISIIVIAEELGY